LELANGYYELTDAVEQQRRFEKDVKYRRDNCLAPVPFDRHLITALVSGMPACSGVAVGVDRMLMVIGEKSSIDEVLSFSI